MKKIFIFVAVAVLAAWNATSAVESCHYGVVNMMSMYTGDWGGQMFVRLPDYPTGEHWFSVPSSESQYDNWYSLFVASKVHSTSVKICWDSTSAGSMSSNPTVITVGF